MSGQMNLLAPPSDGPIEVPISRSVLFSGAKARIGDGRGKALFPHSHLPPIPPKLAEETHWLAVLDFAEAELRFNRPACAILDLGSATGSGCSGGISGPSGPTLMASSRGIEVDGRLVTWPQLLKGRREQRDVEFDRARARDLAEAYRLLDYYGHVYGDGPPYSHGREEWTPVPLIRRLAEEAIDLGGSPARLEPRSDYMRQGIREATR